MIVLWNHFDLGCSEGAQFVLLKVFVFFSFPFIGGSLEHLTFTIGGLFEFDSIKTDCSCGHCLSSAMLFSLLQQSDFDPYSLFC